MADVTTTQDATPLTDEEIAAAWNSAFTDQPDAGSPTLYLHYMRAVARAAETKQANALRARIESARKGMPSEPAMFAGNEAWWNYGALLRDRVTLLEVQKERIYQLHKGLMMESDKRYEDLRTTCQAALVRVGELQKWVDDLQSGMYVNCVYCGHRYGPNETTPITMADALKRHVEACPKHPLSVHRNAVQEFLSELCETMGVELPDNPKVETSRPLILAAARDNRESLHDLQGAEQRAAALQAKVDRLMLEYCPDEMTQEQKDNWAAHQQLATDSGTRND